MGFSGGAVLKTDGFLAWSLLRKLHTLFSGVSQGLRSMETMFAPCQGALTEK